MRHAGAALLRHRAGGSRKPLIDVTISPEDDDVEVFGKLVSELQDEIEITNPGFSGAKSVVNGKLNYVSGYTGFSPGNPVQQEGHYLAMRFDTDDADDVITVELIGGTDGHPWELDADRNVVFRITNKDTQSIKVVVTHTNEDESTVTTTTSLSLKGLERLPEDED